MINAIKEKISDKYFIKKLFIIFLMIQPILDLNILYSEKVMNFFKFSPSTLIRLGMILLLIFMVFLSNKKGKQEKFLLGYLLLIAVYTIFHHINVLNFKANITSTYNYSFFNELFYIFRMTLPILIIYLVYNIKLKRKELNKVISTVVFLFCFTIIVSNIFKFGIASYGGGKLKYNIFDWFIKDGLLVSEVGCRGLFEGANRLGVLLSALLPMNLYYFLTEKSNKRFFLLFIHILGTIMIGTKVATYTWIAVMAVMFLLYVIFSLLKKIHFSFKKIGLFIFLFCLGFLFTIKSPVTTSTEVKDAKKKFEETYTSENLSDKMQETYSYEPNAKAEFVANNYQYFWINHVYIFDIYNYKSDPNFWISVMHMPFETRNDDRIIQKLISNHLYTMNDNKYDFLLGMGYSRFKSSDLYLEKDFFVHFYTMGIVGIILFLSPYIIVLLMATIYILKNMKENFRFKLLVYCCSLCIFVFTSLICGHVVDEMVTYVFMAMLSGLILREIFQKKEVFTFDEVKDKISVIVPVYNTENYLRECLDSIIKQEIPNLEVILVNDQSTDGSLKICEEYVEKYHFKLINNKKNSGPAISRNKALKEATGDFIAFVDSDDLLYPNNLKTLYTIMKKENADIVMARLNSFNSKGEYGYYSDKYINDYKEGTIYRNKELVNCISICSKLYKADIIKKIKFLENTLHEDNSFTLITYFHSNKIVTYPEYLYYRRIREIKNDSIMQNLNYKTFSDLIKNYKNVLDQIGKTKKLRFLYFYMIRQLNNNIAKHIKPEEIEKANKDIISFIEWIGCLNRTLMIYHKMYFFVIKVYRSVK